MTVMTACVHKAKVLRLIFTFIEFIEFDAVEIRAKPNDFLAIAALKRANNAGLTNVFLHLNPHFAQAGGNVCRRLDLL